MQNSLMINNMYAAYTATSGNAGRNISDLSKLARAQQAESKATASENSTADKALSMDRLVISPEALKMLGEG